MANNFGLNIASALLGLREADTRRKGEQCGTVSRIGKSWFIRFREWRPDQAGNLEYVQVQRKIEGNFPNNERGRRQAEQAGYEQHVVNANLASKVPQGLATLEQFYATRFQPDHVDLLKKSGRKHYATMWRNHIQPTLGSIQMREVTPQIVQQLVSAKLGVGYSPQTIHHIHKCTSAIFRHAKALRFYSGDLPTEGVKLPKLTHKERMALTWEQVKVLADTIPRHRNLIIVLAQTGMRIGEACGLRWQCVNLADDWRIVEGEAVAPQSLLVCSNWTKGERTSTKNRAWRKIPLTAEAWTALSLQWEMAKFRGDDLPVFASRVGTPIGRAQR